MTDPNKTYIDPDDQAVEELALSTKMSKEVKEHLIRTVKRHVRELGIGEQEYYRQIYEERETR